MIQSLKEQLSHLQNLLYQLSDVQYNFRSTMLNHGSIGQHVRHVIELVQCLVSAYDQGTVDYDKRRRDERIETIREFALLQLDALQHAIDRPEKRLQLRVATNDNTHTLETWYHREVFYNTEHAIHHMALIRVALKEMQLDVVNDSFGVAYATLRHKQVAYGGEQSGERIYGLGEGKGARSQK